MAKQPAVIEARAADEGTESRGETTVSMRLSTLILLGAVVLLAIGVLASGWGWYAAAGAREAARTDVAALRTASDNRHHAEQVAGDYALGAANMDFKNLPDWSKRLTANTSPELAHKLTQAATSMEQIIVPLQWVSTPTPIAAIVRSEHDGVYVVNCFVSVMTKNTQAPDGIQSTATYTVTVDKNADWKITDVGGIDSALGGK
ncbi:hypothetical protein [Nocardia pseudobrasiliensis]|uniref:Mce-associated membrane protein n=1 Tax=Nocardia pseudobrasiliensis TaxID=45979 RepID=A0A370ICA3_9NOCA|nr:hypothetical protein [Nocardia pseudobrasiliensis]RDI68368.1 Mce-associated membrane protein [Nocardia pseudobrasiliensis]